MRHAARVDGNHAEIRDLLAQVPGVVVHDCSKFGGGFPDLLVGARGRLHLLEIKNGRKPPSARRVNDLQKKFHARFAGYDVHVVTSFHEALQAIGLTRRDT